MLLLAVRVIKETAMAKIIDLEMNQAGECPGDLVFVTATTEPPDTLVKWRINGIETPTFSNTLRTRIGQESQIVEASLDDSSASVTVPGKIADLEVELVPPPTSLPAPSSFVVEGYFITDEPKLPVITAKAIGIGGSPSGLQWRVTVETDPTFIGELCTPNVPPDIGEIFDFSPTDGGQEIAIDFGGLIRGSSLHIGVTGLVNGCPVRAGAGFLRIAGTNPERSAVAAALPHDTLRRIACKESGQRQFDAPADGGTGLCPLFGPDGRVGIMQIANPTPDEVWNWRANITKGIELFNEKVDDAGDYPNSVRMAVLEAGSEAEKEFNRLVSPFNQRRQQQGLNPIQVTIPEFTTGSFDDNDKLQQLELDAIRGYNGWHGPGRFGLKLHEFRVAVERIEGEEVLIVANVNEETLQGEAVWERVPVADRPADSGTPNYVEEMLAFDFECSPAPAPSCPALSLIDIDPSDTRTHNFHNVHLVTVKGTGDIVLRATIIPDTPRLRSQLTWEADGAVITSPALGADRLTAKISRNTPGGARIPVRLKQGSDICTGVVVWIIWCTLAPKTTGPSSLVNEQCGLNLGAGRFLDQTSGRKGYLAHARIDWTATIEPAAIITDTNNRPEIEEQTRVAPPGTTMNPLRDGGVASVFNRDMTGEGFSGWDMSRQRRQKVFIGNPPSVPMAETPANHFPEEDRPIPNYPSDEVEGNDDDSVGADEDSNPYDQGAGTPGKGTRGTLRSTDKPRIIRMDDQGTDGDRYSLRNQFSEFVRVQLGNTWYRCSDFGLWRHHVNAKRVNGEWDKDPARPDEFDATNVGWTAPLN
jgi:hypothetical protein